MALAVVFDFGYTLVNEDRVWKEIAARHGWSDSVFFATLGAVIERRGRHRDVFEILGAADGARTVPFEPGDFYEDAIPCLSAAKSNGWLVGIAGNFSREIERFLAEQVDVDFVASSERWGAEKPSPDFFAHIVSEAGCAPGEIAYVGDRVDNDIVPAANAGLTALFLIRGPWAAIQKDWPEAAAASMRLDDLGSVPL